MESISGISGMTDLGQMQVMLEAARQSGQTKVQEEFMAVFYKELLKQAFTTPSFSIDDEEENNTFKSSFTNDLMVDKLALEMARRQAFSFQKVVK